MNNTNEILSMLELDELIIEKAEIKAIAYYCNSNKISIDEFNYDDLTDDEKDYFNDNKHEFKQDLINDYIDENISDEYEIEKIKNFYNI